MNRQSGFTLIELLVTIAILAIVSAIAIPAYTGYIKSARMTEAKNNIAALKLAEEEFFLENNAYFYGNTNALLNTNSGGLWTAKGTDGAPNFTYVVSGAGTSYGIIATGNDGTPVAGETENYSNQ